jgi:hypothetical protein
LPVLPIPEARGVGATEALRRGRVKVFVKSTGTLAPGNPELLRMGGLPFPAQPRESLGTLLAASQEKNGRPSSEGAGDQAAPAPIETADPGASQAQVAGSAGNVSPPSSPEKPVREAYTLVINDITSIPEQPQSEEWLASKLSVRTAQMKDWLDRAVRKGRIRKLRKPVRYVAESQSLFT